MSSGPGVRWSPALLGVLLTVTPVGAQQSPGAAAEAHGNDRGRAVLPTAAEPGRIPEAAERASGVHVVISRAERRLWLRDGSIVLHEAEVAVGKGGTLSHGGRTWHFSTPAGLRLVIGKEENPAWVPPDWHYVEIAREQGLTLVPLPGGDGVPLADGTRVVVRGERIGRLWPGGRFEAVPPGEEVIYGDTLFVPPFGTRNRRIEGELGRYKLDLGDGYLIHGTPRQDEVGRAVTHGCIRMREEDLAQLYSALPVGAPVYIY